MRRFFADLVNIIIGSNLMVRQYCQAVRTDQNRSLYRRMDNNIRNAIYEEKKAGTHSSPLKSEIIDGVSCVH